MALYIIGIIYLMFAVGSAEAAGSMFGLLVVVVPCTINALMKEKHAHLWGFIIGMVRGGC